MFYRTIIPILSALTVFLAAACSQQGAKPPENKAPVANAETPAPAPSRPTGTPKAVAPTKPPAKNLTSADIAKLGWLEGNWRGRGAQQPFYNRYHLTATTLDIDSFDDAAMTKKADSSHYELKDGMFAMLRGEDRFAVSEITDRSVELVALTGRSTTIRMESVGDGTVKIVLEQPTPDGDPTSTSFILEPIKK